MEDVRLISGNSNQPLAAAISKELGIPLTEASVRRFSDSESFVEIKENVRGCDVFVIQPTSCPANDHLMELFIMLDTLKRSSARRVTAVMPYFGYARQDRRSGPRTPISAKLVADILTQAGAHRVLALDLHSGQVQGFFDIPVDNLYVAPVFVKDIKSRLHDKDIMVVSPDVGGVVRARAIAKRLEAELAIIDKRRERANESEVMNIIGKIKDRHCLLMDDIVDTAGTLCNAADALMQAGAASVRAYTAHGVLSGPALERINGSEALKELIISDTIQAREDVLDCDKIRVLTIAPLLAEAIRRIYSNKSVSDLLHSF